MKKSVININYMLILYPLGTMQAINGSYTWNLN